MGSMRLLAVVLALAAGPGFQASVRPLSPAVRSQVVASGHWHSVCPVSLSGLRLLKVSYWGFDGQPHSGSLVVNARAVGPLTTVFSRPYALHFPIHHIALSAEYGPASAQPADGDVTASFEC